MAPADTPVSARSSAARLLSQVLGEKRPFEEAFAREKGVETLSARDRNFTRLLVLTTLRRLGQIDALLAGMLERPLKGKSQQVMHCLRLGAAQLLWLKTPPHAAVHETVETVAALGFAPMKGLTNAVLKRIAREGSGVIAMQDETRINLPPWLFDSWRVAYGEAAARAMAAAALEEPPLDITAKKDAADWAKKLGGTLLAGGTIRLESAGRIEELPGYDEGAWWVQDEAAAMPAKLLGDVAGRTVIDLCAAPGGKSAQLAAAGAHVIAVDKSKSRLTRLQTNMGRLQLSVQAVTADALQWKPAAPPDAVLLDAPCSSTGTLRRHPDVAWHRTPQEVQKLAQLQKRLLARAASWLMPDGRLMYCVCSLQPEEGDGQIESFLNEHPRFKVQGDALRTQLSEKRDGFYAICLVRLNDL